MHHRLVKLMRDDERARFEENLSHCQEPDNSELFAALCVYADRFGELALIKASGGHAPNLEEQRALAQAVLEDSRFLAKQDHSTLTIVIARMGSGAIRAEPTEAMLLATLAATVIATESVPLEEILRFYRGAGAAARKRVANYQRLDGHHAGR